MRTTTSPLRMLASVALVVVLALASGCASSAKKDKPAPAPWSPGGGQAPMQPGDEDFVEELKDTWMEQAKGENIYQFVDEFTTNYPNRFPYSPNYPAAREHLKGRLTTLGYDVKELPAKEGGSTLVAILPGRLHTHLIIGAHYDTYYTSTFGAYDDSTGIGAVLELARVLQTREWNHTIEFIIFDEEDMALAGSKTYVRKWLEEGQNEIAAMFYFAMVGVNSPCAKPTGETPPLRALVKEHPLDEGYVRLYQSVSAAAAYFPTGSVVAENNSDPGVMYSEFSFESASVPNLLLIGEFEKQVAVANVPFGSYPFAHSADLQQLMEVWCGGKENLVAAYQLSLDYAVRTLVHQDDPPYPRLY